MGYQVTTVILNGLQNHRFWETHIHVFLNWRGRWPSPPITIGNLSKQTNKQTSHYDQSPKKSGNSNIGVVKTGLAQTGPNHLEGSTQIMILILLIISVFTPQRVWADWRDGWVTWTEEQLVLTGEFKHLLDMYRLARCNYPCGWVWSNIPRGKTWRASTSSVEAPCLLIITFPLKFVTILIVADPVL
jgi:hypothetical protein